MRTPSGHAQPLLYFLALSLALHGFVLAAVLTYHPSSPTVVVGGSELRVQMVAPGPRHDAAPAVPLRSSSAAIAIRVSHVATQTERDTLSGNTGQQSTLNLATLENYLIGRLQSELSRHLVYPRLARERGWQGTVLVSVVLAPDGVVQGLRLVHSSGHFLLDDASLTGLRKLHTLSLAGDQRWSDPIEVMLPIRFQLIDNG